MSEPVSSRQLRIARRIFEAWCDTKDGQRFLRSDSRGTASVDTRTGHVTINESTVPR